MSESVFDEDEDESGSALEDAGDLEASISTVNSDGDKIDSCLIKKILDEMKSEFTKAAPTDTKEEIGSEDEEETGAGRSKTEPFKRFLIGKIIDKVKDESDESETSTQEKTDVSTEVTTDLDIVEREVEVKGEESEAVKNANKVDEALNETNNDTPINEASQDDVKMEESGENSVSNRTEEEKHEAAVSEVEPSTFVSPEKIIPNNKTENRNEQDNEQAEEEDEPEEEEEPLPKATRRKRSLRNQTPVKAEPEENTNVKRSSRRFSKEFCRESVLQNAIARKEKSFSSLSSGDERSYRRGARSPRQSTVDTRQAQNKSTGKNKSPKTIVPIESKVKNNSAPPLEEKIEIAVNNTAVDCNNQRQYKFESVEKPSNDFGPLVTETKDYVSSVLKYNLNEDLRNELDEKGADSNDSSKKASYTKTGKRKPRHFKGLKYSFRGGQIKNSNRTWTISRRRRNDCDKSVAVTKDEGNVFASENADLLPVDVSEVNGIISETEVKEEEKGEDCVHLNDPLNSVGGNKRKLDNVIDYEVIDKKRLRQDAPSPNVGEVLPGPDKPEPAVLSTWCDTNSFCLCNSKVQYYASVGSCRSELYCQAIDSLDGRLIGCCNNVDTTSPRIVRASVKVPYQVLCDVHHQRLLRHNCCPGCGNFCTQGKFVQCSAGHHYHRDCQAVLDDKLACPHCGIDSDTDVNISLGAHKYPVFLPLQKPPKQVPSAKMTFSSNKFVEDESEAKGERTEEDDDENGDEKNPIVPPAAIILPSGLKITSEGIPPLEKDKLDRLLHVACTISQPSARYTLRSMYQAARSGDAEKMVHMLAAGLNPNHQFREWIMGSALHAACHGGHIAVAHLLLQAGAHTDVLDKEQNTPLMLAVMAKHNDIVKYLVKAGASVTFKGGDGMTALHLAAKMGNLEACHYLLSNPNLPRFFIDTVDDGRWTPLVWAAEHCHTDVVRFLLEKRADPLVRDAEQNIGLHWAALAGSLEISEALLNYGSEINCTNAHGDTALHIATRQNAYSCVVLLLARGARVDLHNRVGFTPLECCLIPDSPTYNAIKLNVELRSLTGKSRRQLRILTNDITRGHETNPVQCLNAVDDEGIPQDFVYVTENCFTSNITVDRTITSLQSCKCKDTTACTTGCCMCGKISIRCWYDNEGRLLPEFNFADPPMLFECNTACTCNKVTCKNRVVQHGISARFQLFRTKTNKGWGVRTLRLIPKGTYVCEYIGEIISDCEADTREDDSYLFDLDNRDGETYCIDARRYGNVARFINHMCVPNLLPVRVFIDHQDLHFPRIAFFANRDIMANEELGFDYGEKFWIIKYKSFTCTCGAERCRYSETTIQQTLDNYNRKLQQEDIQCH